MRLSNGLKLSTNLNLFDERDQLQFFKPLDRAHQTAVTPYRIGQARRAYFLEVIGKLIFESSAPSN